MIAGASWFALGHHIETKLREVELGNEGVDCADCVRLVNVVVEVLR